MEIIAYTAEERMTIKKGYVLIVPQNDTSKKDVRNHYKTIYDKDYILVLHPREIKKHSHSVSRQLGTRKIVKTILTGMHELDVSDMEFIMSNTTPLRKAMPPIPNTIL